MSQYPRPHPSLLSSVCISHHLNRCIATTDTQRAAIPFGGVGDGVGSAKRQNMNKIKKQVSHPYSIIKLCSHSKGMLYVSIFYHGKTIQNLSWPQMKKTLSKIKQQASLFPLKCCTVMNCKPEGKLS